MSFYSDDFVKCSVCGSLRPLKALLWNAAQKSWDCSDLKWCVKAAKLAKDAKETKR